MIGYMVRSKAGHDKDSIYFVLNIEKESAFLVDGKIRTITRPKKKNLKHLQIIKKETELGQKIINGNNYNDEEIKRTIKLFLEKQ